MDGVSRVMTEAADVQAFRMQMRLDSELDFCL
jgi:hypothetical protein